MPAQMRADRDVFQDAHVRHQFDMLERPGMPSLTISCGGAWWIGLPSTEMWPLVAGSTPVMRLKVVLLPAPFGPIRATISRALDVKRDVVDGDHAAELLACLADFQQHVRRFGWARASGQKRATYPAACAAARRPQRHQPRPDAGGCELQQHHQEQAEHDGFELALAMQQ